MTAMAISRRYIPVRAALTGWYLLVVGVAIVVFSAVLYLAQERTLHEQLDHGVHIAGRQALALVNDDVEPPRFERNETFGHVSRHLTEAGFGVALLAPSGHVIDRFGRNFAWPEQMPAGAGMATLHEGPAETQQWRVDWRVVQRDDGTTVGWLGTGLSLGPPLESLRTLYRTILWSIPVALLIAGFAGYGLARLAMRPVDRMTRFVRALGARDLDRRLGQEGPDDELGRLATTLDDLLARLEASFERERRFVADAAHELRTPLAAMKSRLEVIARMDRTASEYRAALTDVAGEVERLIRLARDLLLLARLEQGSAVWERAAVDVSQLCERTVEQMQPLAHERGLSIETEVAPDLIVEGSIDHLLRALVNMLDNAIKYSEPPSEIRLAARAESAGVLITVTNKSASTNGALRVRVGERFLRADDARSRDTGGAGLGLAIVSEIARRHSGSLTLESHSPDQVVASLRLACKVDAPALAS
jgi:signal transduction histidine kinase